MSISINDSFTFGKFKGKTFSEVMLLPDGPGWCCWLREEKKKDGQPRAFDTDANKVIDEAIRNSKSLRRRFSVWNATEQDLQETIKRQIEAQEERDLADRQRELAYADQWGEW